MKVFSLLLSLLMIGTGIYWLVSANDSTNQGYGLGALIIGAIWLLVDIVRLKKDSREK